MITPVSNPSYSFSNVKYSAYSMSYVEHRIGANYVSVAIPSEYFSAIHPESAATVMTSEGHFLTVHSYMHFYTCEVCGVFASQLPTNAPVCYAFFKAITKGLDYLCPVHIVMTFCSEECLTLFLLSDRGNVIPKPCEDIFLPF